MKNFRTCFLVAAVFLLLYIATDVFLPQRTMFPDEGRYIEEARTLAYDGNFLVGNDKAWEMPLTAIVYSGLLRTFGEDNFIRSVRVFQSFILALMAVGVGLLTWIIFKSRLSSFFATLATLLYPSLVAYKFTLLSEILFTFLLVWSFVFLYFWRENKKNIWLIISILSFGLSAYTRATLTVIVPLFVFLAVLGNGEGFRRSLRYFAASAAIFALCMSPWWGRNYAIFGQFIPFTTSATWNLYLGNNAANTTASIDWGETGADPKELAEIYALGDELAISKAFGDKAKAYIIENPGTFTRNAWLKFKRFWNFTSNYDAPAQQSFFFKAYNASLLLSWLPIFCLALISFALNRRMWRKLMPIYCLIAYFTFIHVVVIASLRYRLPIEPFFIVMASDTARRVWERFKNR